MKNQSNAQLKRRKKRQRSEIFFNIIMRLSIFIVVSCLLIILITIFLKGIQSLSIEMLTKTAEGGFYIGEGGGILNAIIGSLYIALGSVFIAFSISIFVVIYLRVFAKKDSPLTIFIRFSLDVLSGVPSIVYGAFGFTLMLLLGLRASLLAGIITVSLLILPIMIRSIDEVAKSIPDALLEASYSIGATKLETSFKVVIRQIVPGIVSALLISFGRAIGDAASVLFTAGFTDNIPTSLSQPVATLPLAIFFQLTSPNTEVQKKAYASALVLTVIILLTSILTRYACKKLGKYVIK